MRTYNVKQIAELLDTSPETVRRWIRSDRLHALQDSRKEGNVVTEEELERFLKGSPKYLSRITAGYVGLALLSSPIGGLGLLASGILTGAMLGFMEAHGKSKSKLLPKDLEKYLDDEVKKLESSVAEKRTLLKKTENEISSMTERIEQYRYILDHEEIIEKMVKNVNHKKNM